jgi:molybdopterin synthase catalytic subunit
MPRDVDRLEYEAYHEMAEERITAILADCLELHDLRAIAAEHRVGSVELSEPSVIVAAAAAHRAEAFAGARQAIDRIKAEAPVWKREIDTDGRMRRPTGVVPAVGPTEEPPAMRRTR